VAVYAMTATQFVVNSQDHVSKVKSLVLNVTAEQLDTTNMSSSGWKEMIGGLKGGSISLTLMDDFADNGLDEDIFDIIGTVVAVTAKPTGAGISTSNPEFQFSVLCTDWNFGGGVGELAEKSVTWPITGAVTRDVTA